MKSPDITLMPRPQILKLEKSDEKLSGISAIDLPEDFPSALSGKASSLINKKTEGRTLLIRKNKKLARNDEYHIDFSNVKIILEEKDSRASFCGLCTLSDINSRYSLRFNGSISDWADLEMRILMIDLKRIGWDFDYLLETIERAARKKINYVMIE